MAKALHKVVFPHPGVPIIPIERIEELSPIYLAGGEPKC
tara:strand:+ start:238 stop:354 length:117 start_codon:yes stop_codon:yes gene_type:complete